MNTLPKYLTRISDGRRLILTARDTYVWESDYKDGTRFMAEYSYNYLMVTKKGYFE